MFRIFVSGDRASALCLAVLIGLVFAGVGRATTQPTCTVEVRAGQSIQAAINNVPSGATVCVGPGAYQENLIIAKDGITLKGAGPGITILQPPAHPVPVCLVLYLPPVDVENTGLNGICVANVDQQGNILGVVNDVRVTGFTVQGFPGVGIVFAGANRLRADHNVAANNGQYGITAFGSTHGVFEDNTSYGSGDAGFYVGDSPKADFTVRNNIAYSNLWGILLRDSATGTVTGNMLHGNCSGLVFLNTGISTGVHNWQSAYNAAEQNDNFCPAGELPFGLTGVGVLIAGGDHIQLRENIVRANQPSGAPSIINGVGLAGGIVVVSTASISVFPGYFGSVAAHNIILNNAVHDNNPSTWPMTGWARTTTLFPTGVKHRLPPGCAHDVGTRGVDLAVHRYLINGTSGWRCFWTCHRNRSGRLAAARRIALRAWMSPRFRVRIPP